MTDILPFPRPRRIPVQSTDAPAAIPLCQRFHGDCHTTPFRAEAIIAGAEAELIRERDGQGLPDGYREDMLLNHIATVLVGALTTPGDAVRMRQRIIEWFEEGRRQAGPDGAA